MLLKMVWSGKLAVFYIFGFVMIEYMKLPLIALAALGVVFAVVIALNDRELLLIKNKKSSSGDESASDVATDEEEDFLS